MRTIKQILEQYDVLTEKEEKDNRKLSALVRAGLYDAKKLPALKKALEKGADKMTAPEKRMLLNLLDSLMSEVLGSSQVYNKVKHDVSKKKLDESKYLPTGTDKRSPGQGYLSGYDPRGEKNYPTQQKIPAILILKRKAIRVYPDQTKVALYYAQLIDKYISIPVNDEIGVPAVNEAFTKPSKESREDEKEMEKQTSTRQKAGELAFKLSQKSKKRVAQANRAAAVVSKVTGGKSKITGADIMKKRGQSTEPKTYVAKDVLARREKLNFGKGVSLGRQVAAFKQKGMSTGHGVAAALGNKLGKKLGLHESKKIVIRKKIKDNKMKTKPLDEGFIWNAIKKVGKKVLKGVGKLAGAVLGGDEKSSSSGSSASREASSYKAPSSMKTTHSAIANAKKASTGADAQMASYERTNARKLSMQKESVITTIQEMVKNATPEQSIRIGDKEITINTSIANKLNNLYECMNRTNKKKMEDMLSESVSSFNKILTFAVRH